MCSQSYPTLRDSMDCNPTGSSVHGILQAKILEWVALPTSRGPPDPGIEPMSLCLSALASGLFTTSTTWETQKGRYLNSTLSLINKRTIKSYVEILNS